MRTNFFSQLVGVILLFSTAAPLAVAQEMRFAVPAAGDDAAAMRALPSLASDILAVYQTDNSGTDPRKLFWAQLAAGRYAQAYTTVSSWLAANADSASFDDYATMLPFELYAKAKLNESAEPAGFDAAFRKAFREVFDTLDNTDAYAATAWLSPPPLEGMRARVSQSLEDHRGKDLIEIDAALELCRLYAVLQTYEAIAPITEALIAGDDAKRHQVREGQLGNGGS